MLGVYREELVEKLAHVLHRLGCRRGFVVHGLDGMDEITLTTETAMAEVSAAGVTVRRFAPEELGFGRCAMAELRGGNALENAVIVRDVLAGQKGPKRDIVLINAAFGLVAAGKAANLSEGVLLAEKAIDSGEALAVMERLVAMTNE